MLRRISAVILALVLLCGTGGAGEVLHGFLGHTDTVHTHADGNDAGGPAAGPQHTHCVFLDFSLPPFLAWSAPVVCIATPLLFGECPPAATTASVTVARCACPDTRGPPAA